MTSARDPERLMDDLTADPLLRAALSVARREAPTDVQLDELVKSLGKTVPAASAPRAGLNAGKWRKWMLLIGAVGLGYVGTLPSTQPASVAPLPPTSQEPGHHELHETAREPATPAQGFARRSERDGMRSDLAEPRDNTPATPGKSAPLVDALPEGPPADLVEQTSQAPAVAGAARRAAPPTRPARVAQGERIVRERTRSELANVGVGEVERVPSELELLGQAQTVLTTAPREALKLLSEHELHHAQGQFAEERDVLRLEVLERLARTGELEQRARAFMARYPRSVHRERVQRMLEGADSPP